MKDPNYVAEGELVFFILLLAIAMILIGLTEQNQLKDLQRRVGQLEQVQTRSGK